MDCSLPRSSVHGVSQPRIPEWVAISSSRGSSQPRDQPVSPALQAASSSLHHLGRQTSNSTSQFWMLQELQKKKKKFTSYKPNLCFLKKKVKIAQSCPILCDPRDYTVHRILQARILEWVAYSFSRGSSQPRDGTQVSHIAGRFFTNWATIFLTEQQM